jgi:hypothetical protein
MTYSFSCNVKSAGFGNPQMPPGAFHSVSIAAYLVKLANVLEDELTLRCLENQCVIQKKQVLKCGADGSQRHLE